jgi:putative PIN family toxin of toxin-antitoxin system
VRVVVDTNITVSAALNPRGFPAKVVEAFITGRFQLVSSEPMLAELADILARPRVARRLERNGFTAADRAAFVALVRAKAELVPVSGEVELCRDPDDNAIIETALRGHVDVLVSRDEDMTRGWEVITPLERAGIRVLTVARFLEALDREADPEGV